VGGQCGSSPVTPTLDFYLTISNNWVDSSDQDHSFQLQSNDDGKASGSIGGEERVSGTKVNDVEGNWIENKVSLTIDPGGPNETTYTAVLTSNSPDTLEFTTVSDTLVLNRN
jgi:hypothetical protein